MDINFIYLIKNDFPVNHYVPLHTHSCYELLFYYDTPSIINYGNPILYTSKTIDFAGHYAKTNHVIEVKPRKIMIIQPNIPHDELHQDTNRVIAIGFYVNDFNIDSICLKPLSLDTDVLVEKLDEIANEYSNKKFGYQDYIKNTLSNIIISLIRLENKNQDANEGMPYVKEYIKQNLGRNISVKELAENMGYSTSHFRKLFIEHFGCSPKQYIESTRYKLAKKMLLETNMMMKEISSYLGFTNYFQFAAFYKKISGISPTEERENQSNC